jgi:hypothetical protein
MLKALVACAAALALGLGSQANSREAVENGAPVTLSVLGEFTPSTGLAAGAAIEALGFEQKVELTRQVMSALPIQDLAALFGLGLRGFDWSYGSGGYQQSIAPNIVATVSATERARVSAFALAWMYVYEQDAVPDFAAASAGRPAMRIRFERALTPAREGTMFASLIAALGKDAGYTRTGEREIVVIDFEERATFDRDIASFTSSMAKLNPVVAAERFNARCEYRSHDWRAEPDGWSLLEEIGKLFPAPGMETKLRALRARYERLVSGWLALPSSTPDPAYALHKVMMTASPGYALRQ